MTINTANTLGDRAFPVAAARAEQSASTDQGRLVAAVFSTADKGPSVSAVIHLTSDYYHHFFNLICKVPL